MLDKIVQEFPEHVDLIKVDADKEDNFELLAQYEVKSIPTLVLLYGDKIIGKSIGMRPEQELRDWLQLHVNYVTNLEELENENSTKVSD